MSKKRKITFTEYWNSMPDERNRGVEYRQVYDDNGNKYPYVISSEGTIRNITNNHILKQHSRAGYGYVGVQLFPFKQDATRLKPIRVNTHRLLMKAFGKLSEPDQVVNHKSFSPTDNTIDNLEVCTQKDNVRYSFNAGHMKVPRPNDEKAIDDAISICEYLTEGGLTFEEIAERVGRSVQHVRRLYNRKYRTDISKDYVFKPRNYFSISSTDADRVCSLLETQPDLSDESVSNITGVIPEFVRGLREGRYRKDITHNRSIARVPIESIELMDGEDIDIAIYYGRTCNLYVTTYGRVIDFIGNEVKPYINTDGFKTVNIKDTTGHKTPISIHMAVACTFVDNPNKYTSVGFRDLDRYNCAADNLIWISNSERLAMSSKNKDKALTLERAKHACKLISEGLSNVAISNIVGITKGMVKSIRDKKIIRWISDEYFGERTNRINTTGKTVNRFSLSEKYDMLDMINHGYSTFEVADKYNTSRNYVNDLLHGKHMSKSEFDHYNANKNLVIVCGRHTRKNQSKKDW